ncbi:MAG: mannose-6-phosphate isomerase, partial [Clostridiales bacterium]|nr:mannose-6-phosphate isomerase [Clostridiales bacterium]
KIIKSQDVLSVQVHPGDEYAKLHEQSLGKTEMWYILEAEDGSGIYAGFNRELSRDELCSAISDGTIREELRFHGVKPGDAVFIPAGMCHAIGGGLTIAEIQQSSDITYRLYDWDRVSGDGKKRELHIKKSLDVTDTGLMPHVIDTVFEQKIVSSRYFDVFRVKDSIDIQIETFAGVYILSGEAGEYQKCDTLFIDDSIFHLNGNFEALIFSTHKGVAIK